MKSNKVLNVTHKELEILHASLSYFSLLENNPYDTAQLEELKERLNNLCFTGSNILNRANKIVNEQAEEKVRQYGNFDESIQRVCNLFNIIRKQNLQPIDVYWVLIALKLSRESITHREDNLLDAVAYIGALNNYLENGN